MDKELLPKDLLQSLEQGPERIEEAVKLMTDGKVTDAVSRMDFAFLGMSMTATSLGMPMPMTATSLQMPTTTSRWSGLTQRWRWI